MRANLLTRRKEGQPKQGGTVILKPNNTWAASYLVQAVKKENMILRNINEPARRFAKEIVD